MSVQRRVHREDDEGKGSYVFHKGPGKGYWYRHYRSKITGKVVAIREDPPGLKENPEITQQTQE